MGLIQDWILPATIGSRRKQSHGRGDPGQPATMGGSQEAGFGGTVDSDERRTGSDFRQNSSTVAISSAPDHVNGETESGAPVFGSSCSDRSPPSSWWAATQLMISRAGPRSCAVFAVATNHWAIHRVQMNQGLPGTLFVFDSTLK